MISFQQPVLLQDSKEECKKGNSSDCCEEEEDDDESGSTCSTSEHEEIEKLSDLSKEDRKLQRKVLRLVEVSFNFNICDRILPHCTFMHLSCLTLSIARMFGVGNIEIKFTQKTWRKASSQLIILTCVRNKKILKLGRRTLEQRASRQNLMGKCTSIVMNNNR